MLCFCSDLFREAETCAKDSEDNFRNEDNGTTAAWYIFANIGIYPICPGKAEYTATKQMAGKAKILGKELDLSDCGGVISHEALMKRLGN